MGLEQDINQSIFRNEYHKLAINFIYTYNWLSEQMKHIFEKEGITSQQFNILRILRGAGEPISTMQIRQRMLDKMSDTSRIVDRLLVKELVAKNTSTLDKRLVDVSITEKGKLLLQKLDAHEKEMDDIFKNLQMVDAEKMNLLLDKMRQQP